MMSSSSASRLSAVAIALLWAAMALTVLTARRPQPQRSFPSAQTAQPAVAIPLAESLGGGEGRPVRARSTLQAPARYALPVSTHQPPSVEEVGRNLTRYLHELHDKLGALAGPTVTALKVWETFLDVTRRGPMAWDEQNQHRFPAARSDSSIFVALGTYRDPFCAMTMKNLFDMAAHPERLFVSLFQQNCFGPVCRTGVLVGGKVDYAGADDDCYEKFCASEEGVRSGACGTDRIRLFNVNESESLGPYMARYVCPWHRLVLIYVRRYMGAKFYGGEEYYLQIDSHSEFIRGWDDRLVEMVVNAPGLRPPTPLPSHTPHCLCSQEGDHFGVPARLARRLEGHPRVVDVRQRLRGRPHRVPHHPTGGHRGAHGRVQGAHLRALRRGGLPLRTRHAAQGRPLRPVRACPMYRPTHLLTHAATRP